MNGKSAYREKFVWLIITHKIRLMGGGLLFCSSGENFAPPPLAYLTVRPCTLLYGSGTIINTLLSLKRAAYTYWRVQASRSVQISTARDLYSYKSYLHFILTKTCLQLNFISHIWIYYPLKNIYIISSKILSLSIRRRFVFSFVSTLVW